MNNIQLAIGGILAALRSSYVDGVDRIYVESALERASDMARKVKTKPMPGYKDQIWANKLARRADILSADAGAFPQPTSPIVGAWD